MSLTLTITATHRTGNFIKIFSALRRLGLTPQNGAINNAEDPTVDSVQIHLKDIQRVKPSILDQLREMVPTIVDIEIDTPVVTNKRVTVATDEAVNSADNPTQPASQLPKFDDERLNFETKRLANSYPSELFSALKYMEATLNPTQRQVVLTELGNRIGMYAARKRKSNEKSSGVTNLRGLMSVQRSQLGRVSPVVAAMAKRQAAKKSRSKESKSKVITSELGNFLSVSINRNEVHLTNCPHCASTHAPQSPDCYFISSFIDSFITDMWGDDGHSVTQTASRSTGASACVFVISGIRLL